VNKAVFLDRDGTLAKDVHYCSRVEDFHLFPFVPDAIKLLNRNGFKVIIVTNQSGIARGIFTEDTLALIHQKMRHELACCEATIDAVYYCPHHPQDVCECRKPKPKLILEAAALFDISLNNSYMIGDMLQDVEAGKAAGCKTILISSDNVSIPDDALKPDKIASDALEAVKWVIAQP
jgi:D,D-heptose 1,7-bisphosphate phosphatase